ncbi:TolC family protein [Emticicia sp. ODNR4P]|nr:TolC family protein [Emticicia sp. ODNR4P]
MTFLAISLMPVRAQKVWNLHQCIQHAQNNNLQIKQTRLNQELALEKTIYTKTDLYPTVQFSVSPTLAMGRSLDPTTYQYATNGFINNIMGVNMNQVLWAGGRKKNSHQQSIVEQEIANLQEQKNTVAIAIQITQAYFQILLQQVYVKSAERQLGISSEQLAVFQKANTSNPDTAYSVLEWQAQVANDEFTLTKYKNELKTAQINLGTLLALPDPLGIEIAEIKDETFTVDRPIGQKKGEYDLFYKMAYWHPSTKITQLNQKLVALQYDAVKASAYPTISLAAGVSLPFSSLFREVDQAYLVRTDTIPVYSQGQLRLALSPNYAYSYKTTSFFSQWKQLASAYVGFQINLPIITGGLRKYQQQQAAINIENAHISMLSARAEIYKEALLSTNNLEAAILQYQAAQKTLQVWQVYFNTTLQKVQRGEVKIKDFESVKNSFFTIQQNAEIAKYDWLLKKKIYQYYSTGNMEDL